MNYSQLFDDLLQEATPEERENFSHLFAGIPEEQIWQIIRHHFYATHIRLA